MQDENEDLRQVMRNWASGVTVVTAKDGDQFHGMTVSAFTSISLQPPLVLVSLEKTSRTHAMVQNSNHFGVTILADDQKDISDRFAGRIPAMDGNRFLGLAIETLTSGVPFIVGGLAYLDCHIVLTYDTRLHTLFIGEVDTLCSARSGKPLLYHDQDYNTLM
jgi:flavin reductase (DIM6/NTAB) family NADH-FMN oxidoreductase RutF